MPETRAIEKELVSEGVKPFLFPCGFLPHFHGAYIM
jgi:hypothetical protein